MFGREKYDPELSKSLSDKKDNLEEKRDELMSRIIHRSQLDRVLEQANSLSDSAESVAQSLDKQVNLGQVEAEKLNREYSEKLAEAKRVMDDLFQFESEKLGMHQEPQEESVETKNSRKENDRQRQMRDFASAAQAYEARAEEEARNNGPDLEYFKRVAESARRHFEELKKVDQAA